MRVTLMNVLNDIRTFVNNHYILKEFYDNDLLTNSEVNINYPIVAVTYGDSNISDGVIEMSMQLYVLDLLNTDKSNRVQIMNDTLLSAIDIKTYFRDTECKLGWWIDSSATISNSPLVEINADITSGKILNCTVKIPYDTALNSVPI